MELTASVRPSNHKGPVDVSLIGQDAVVEY